MHSGALLRIFLVGSFLFAVGTGCRPLPQVPVDEDLVCSVDGESIVVTLAIDWNVSPGCTFVDADGHEQELEWDDFEYQENQTSRATVDPDRTGLTCDDIASFDPDCFFRERRR